MIFILSTLILSLVLATKVFFSVSGRGGNPGFLEWISAVVLALAIAAGSLCYIKRIRKEVNTTKKSKLFSFFILLTAVVVGSSFVINLNKKALIWDSIALYDARAKFLLSGTTFSQMVEISKYDPVNSYYYVLYPPYTSIVHFFWYRLGIPLPIGVLYSFLLLFLGVSAYFLTRKRLGATLAIFLTFITVGNNMIFSSSLSEYTNLPYTLQFLLGVWLIGDFLEDKKTWKFFYGSALVVTSQWIRFLEPLWAGVVLALFIAMFKKKKWSRELLLPAVMGIYGVVEYGAWQSFVASFGDRTKIVSFALIKLLDPILGVFTGSAFSVLIFFIKSWGIILLVYMFAIFISYLFKKSCRRSSKNSPKQTFMGLTLLLSVLVYYSGLYFVSFQSVWWDKLGNSLVRGSTFMIPISGYLILEYLHGKKN